MSRPRNFSALRNQLLAALAPGDLALLAPDLRPIELPVRFVLAAPRKPIEYVYFLDRGIASVVATGHRAKREIEIGLIGREGMTGYAIVMGDHQSPNSTYMQVGGAGRRITAEKLRTAIQARPDLHNTLLSSLHVFLTQMSQTAVSNAQSSIEERLARWLLMARDRLDNDLLPLTHEFLSIMLGVRRAGVTVAMHGLEKRGLIRSGRGAIAITDRAGIVRVAGESYGVPEAELQRLLGPAARPPNAPLR